MTRAENVGENGPATRANSTRSSSAHEWRVAEQLQRTGCRGVAQLLRGRHRKRSKTAAPQSSGGHGAGGASNFDQTHLRTKKGASTSWQGNAVRIQGVAVANLMARDVTTIKASQRRQRRVPDQLADGSHATDAVIAEMRMACPRHTSRSCGTLQRLRSRHYGVAPSAVRQRSSPKKHGDHVNEDRTGGAGQMFDSIARSGAEKRGGAF